MSLVTRCPRCRTLFRVTPAQLQARTGRVRCGRCTQAFDAYEALAAEAGNVLAAPQPSEMPEPEKNQTRASEPTASPASAPVQAPPVAPVKPDAPIAAAATPVPTPRAIDTPAEPAAEADAKPRFASLMRKPTPAQMWSIGAAALALVLLFQVLFAYRSDLAARSPAFRSVLAAVCQHAGCRVALPQRPDLVRIEASDVHMVDAGRPQLIQLTATLRSYASYDLGYPALDLVLTNANEHALARRIFAPDEYLDQSRDPQAGIPANAEITVALDLDTGNLNAAGFRLDLLPAP
ncbi:MAG: hypothetical protein JWM26_1847 [Betaproteobacteria bacterium]|nr:hypothetical protein [Betaproteobacteria bacterium]